MFVRFPADLQCVPAEVEIPDDFTCDSRQVVAGGLFAAIPGTRTDGRRFIPQALNLGAKMLLSTGPWPELPEGVTTITAPEPAWVHSYLCRERAGRPDAQLDLCAVTGTNGKTTTAYLIAHLLKHAQMPCGLISTVAIDDGRTAIPAEHTTPDAGTLFGVLRRMADHRLQAAALELSSHALAQGRAYGMQLRCAVFTNLTGDHLDYHRTMENYYQAKKRLFSSMLRPDGAAVVNVDDPYGQRLAAELIASDERRVIRFGSSGNAETRLEITALSGSGSEFRMRGEGWDFRGRTALIGAHNVHNLAGAILAVRDLGVSDAAITAALAQPVRVPGRLEPYAAGSGAKFFIDYAHTDDALTNVLTILRRITTGKLWVVFGAGGDRDVTKRPRMGAAAAAAADVLIVTSDNPRSEAPQEIIRQICTGIPKECRTIVEPDRRRAIELAAKQAQAGDVVLIAGKGHEDYQEIAGVRHHFSDREELLKIVGQMDD